MFKFYRRMCFFFSMSIAVLLSFLPSSAAIYIGGMSFDISVLDGTSAPSNYSYTQNGSAVAMLGRQYTYTVPPIPFPIQSDVTYFLNHQSQGDEAAFITGVNIRGFSNSQSSAGMMFYAQQWIRFSVNGQKKVFIETFEGCGKPIQADTLFTLKPADTVIYIMARIENGTVNFFISYSPIITGNEPELMPVGRCMFTSLSHSFGFFLHPKGTNFDTANFSSFFVIPRTPSNGLGPLSSYTMPNIPGLTDWAATTLPS